LREAEVSENQPVAKQNIAYRYTNVLVAITPNRAAHNIGTTILAAKLPE
jgi:hypothetical protein